MINNKEKATFKIYGIEIKKGVYSKLMVCKSTNESVVIYSINETVFSNPCGKEDIPIDSKNFFGYRIVIVKDDYFEIQPFWDKEAEVFGSDSIVIKWNYSKRVFEVLLTP